MCANVVYARQNHFDHDGDGDGVVHLLVTPADRWTHPPELQKAEAVSGLHRIARFNLTLPL